MCLPATFTGVSPTDFKQIKENGAFSGPFFLPSNTGKCGWGLIPDRILCSESAEALFFLKCSRYLKRCAGSLAPSFR